MMRFMPLVIIISFAVAALPITAQEVARLRCQKSGCPTTEGGLEEPQLIATNSPSAKVFPIIISWFILFLILRLSAQLMGKLLQAIGRITVKIGAAVGHYYELIIQSRRQRQSKSREKRRRTSLTSTSSLGSLADLLDNANGRQRSRRERFDDDSSSAGYSSANSSFVSSGSDSNNSIMDDDEEDSTAMELAALSHSASDSSLESTSTINDGYDSDESTGRGGPAILSKFLEYISESRPSNQVQIQERQHSLPQRQRINGRGRGNVERKSSLELDHKPRQMKNEVGMYKRSGNESHSRRRRYTIDEATYPSYQTHFKASETEKNRNTDRRKRPNLSKSLIIVGSQT